MFSRLQKIASFLCALSLLPALVLPAAALVQPELILDSESAIVMCAETGQVLYAKNPDEQLYPASITKILTGMVALKYGDLDEIITMSRTAYRSVPRDSAHIDLKTGEKLVMRDAMYALSLVSANDAAACIAEAVGGSIPAFADMMNEEAQAAGAVNSHFNNPHGLPDENHYTTARDMALITRRAIETPGFLEIFSTLEYTMAPTSRKKEMPLTSRNQFTDGLLECPGLLFSKTGWTLSAQGTLVTAARQGDVTLIAVVMKSPELEQKYADTQALFDYAFGSFLPCDLTVQKATDLLHGQGMNEKLRCMQFGSFPVMVPALAASAEVGISPLTDAAALSDGSEFPALITAQDTDGSEIFLLETQFTVETDPTWTPAPPPTEPPETEPAQDADGEWTVNWLFLAVGLVLLYLIGLLLYITFGRRKYRF